MGRGNRCCVIIPTGRGPPQLDGVKLTEPRGGLEGTRTPDLGFRKALLYPAELRGHADGVLAYCSSSAKMKTPGGEAGRLNSIR